MDFSVFKDKIFLALDTETTGLSHLDRVIEFGAGFFKIAKLGRGKIINNSTLSIQEAPEIQWMDEMDEFIHPEREISPFIENLTGITNEQLSKCDNFNKVLGKIIVFANRYPSSIVAFNWWYDRRILAYEFEKALPMGVKPPIITLDTPGIDVYAIAQMLMRYRKGLRKLESILSDICEDTGYLYNAHKALDDAKATAFLYACLLSAYPGNDPNIWANTNNLTANMNRQYISWLEKQPAPAGMKKLYQCQRCGVWCYTPIHFNQHCKTSFDWPPPPEYPSKEEVDLFIAHKKG